MPTPVIVTTSSIPGCSNRGQPLPWLACLDFAMHRHADKLLFYFIYLFVGWGGGVVLHTCTGAPNSSCEHIPRSNKGYPGQNHV